MIGKRAHNFIDLTNKRFGRLLVLGYMHTKKKYAFWKCQCDCGKIITIKGAYLRSGDTNSCGCLHKELLSKRNKKNLTGKRFGRLTVLKEAGRDKNRHILWGCLCDCGNKITVSGVSLTSDNTKSCGCYRRDVATRVGIKNPSYNSSITNEERVRRKEKREVISSEAKRWRVIIFKRDDYTCQICGERGGKVRAHHIANWASYPNERFKITNGIVLCQKCHNAFHRMYGRTNNSLHQLEEFRRRIL